jgi:hypothetical protein
MAALTYRAVTLEADQSLPETIAEEYNIEERL